MAQFESFKDFFSGFFCRKIGLMLRLALLWFRWLSLMFRAIVKYNSE